MRNFDTPPFSMTQEKHPITPPPYQNHFVCYLVAVCDCLSLSVKMIFPCYQFHSIHNCLEFFFYTTRHFMILGHF